MRKTFFVSVEGATDAMNPLNLQSPINIKVSGLSNGVIISIDEKGAIEVYRTKGKERPSGEFVAQWK